MAALCFLSLCSLSVKGVAAEELNRARGGHGCCSGRDEQGRGRGNRGRWALAVSLRGSFRLRVQCLPPFGRLQYGKSASRFLMCKQLKRGCVSVEDGESKHLLWDLAVSAAAHLRHLLRREFHTRKIAGGIRLLSGWSLKY